MMTTLIVQRKPTTAETKIEFQFNVMGLEFLVKNFTDSDIYVGFEDEKEKMVLIPAETAQVVASVTPTGHDRYDTVYVIPTAVSEKGVEVQCLRW